MVHFRDTQTGEHLVTLHVLNQGFLWETPADVAAPSGWLRTDREDIIRVPARSADGRHTEVIRHGDRQHCACLGVYSNQRMVTARIAGRDADRDAAALHAGAVCALRLGDGLRAPRGALPPGSDVDADSRGRPSSTAVPPLDPCEEGPVGGTNRDGRCGDAGGGSRHGKEGSAANGRPGGAV